MKERQWHGLRQYPANGYVLSSLHPVGWGINRAIHPHLGGGQELPLQKSFDRGIDWRSLAKQNHCQSVVWEESVLSGSGGPCNAIGHQ